MMIKGLTHKDVHSDLRQRSKKDMSYKIVVNKMWVRELLIPINFWLFYEAVSDPHGCIPSPQADGKSVEEVVCRYGRRDAQPLPLQVTNASDSVNNFFAPPS